MRNRLSMGFIALLATSLASMTAAAEGDPGRGAEAFRQCLACHSTEPGRHLTGPSLAGVVGRRAGGIESFGRYSEALTSSGLTWDSETLDRWLANPGGLVPGTSMRIRPVDDAGTRQDIISYLATVPATGGQAAQGGSGRGGMPDLKSAGPNQQVKAIRHCGDAYRVTLGTGQTYTFWEFNLRFKTDSSSEGPHPGTPAIVPQGMRGDRAQVVFADPAEISPFIRKECPER